MRYKLKILFLMFLYGINIKGETIDGIRKGNHTIGLSLFLSTPPYPLKLGQYSSRHLMEMAAVRYAINLVNKHDFLYGYSLELRYAYLWSPWNDTVEELKRIAFHSLIDPTTAVIIGPETDESVTETGFVLGMACMPHISYGDAHASFKYERKGTCSLRTIASNEYRVEAALDLVNKFDWSFVGVLLSASLNDRDGVRFLNRFLCSSAKYLKEDSDEKDISEILLSFDKDLINVVFLFTSIKDTRYILQVIQNLKLEEVFHLVFVFGKPILDSYFTRSFQEILVGSISIESSFDENEDFKETFLNQKFHSTPVKPSPRNLNERRKGRHPVLAMKHYTAAWEELFECDTNTTYSANNFNRSCSKLLTPSLRNGYYPELQVENLFNAVYGASVGIRDLIRERCNITSHPVFKQSILCHETYWGVSGEIRSKDQYLRPLYKKLDLYAYQDGTLKTVVPWDKTDRNIIQYSVYNFQKHGDNYKNVIIGKWKMNRQLDVGKSLKTVVRNFTLNTSMIYWGNDSIGITPLAKCTEVCPWNSVKEFTNVLKCCWKCILCPPNNIVRKNKCKLCEEGKFSVDGNCEQLPYNDDIMITRPFTLAVLILIFVPFGIVLTFLVIIIKYRENKILKEAEEYFWYSIMIGLLFVPIIPIPYVSQPSTTTCVLRVGLPGLAYTCIYGSLLLKTYRISRTCHGFKTSMNRKIYLDPFKQLSILLGLLICEVMVLLAFFTSSTPKPEIYLVPTEMHYTSYCLEDRNPTALIVGLGLGLICMIWATIFAFKTRNIKKNFRETQNICYTLYLSNVLWAIFLPVYYRSPKYGPYRRYEMSVFSIVMAMLTVCGLYAKKVRLLIQPPQPPAPSQVERSPPDGSSLAPRSRNCSNVDVKGWEDTPTDIHDMQNFLDHHCPPQRRRLRLDECEQVFDGNLFEEEENEDMVINEHDMFRHWSDADSDDESDAV